MSAAQPGPAVPGQFEGEGNSGAWSIPATSAGGPIEFEDRSELVAAHIAAGGEGVLGRMSDLVSFADGYEAVGRRLLGGTVVVENLDRALRLHNAGVKDRLVTLDGDVVDEDGVVAGGSRDAQGAGVLAQKREIRDLEEIVGRLEHDLSEAMQRLVTAKTELKQVIKALEGLRAQAHEGDLAIMGHEKDETRIRADLERYRDRLGHARHRAARARAAPPRRSRSTSRRPASGAPSPSPGSTSSSATSSICSRRSRPTAIASTTWHRC